jgi:hypothetical protein
MIEMGKVYLEKNLTRRSKEIRGEVELTNGNMRENQSAVKREKEGFGVGKSREK